MSMRSCNLFLHSGCSLTRLSWRASIRQDISVQNTQTTSVTIYKEMRRVRSWDRAGITYVSLCPVGWRHTGVWYPERRLCVELDPQKYPLYSPSECSEPPKVGISQDGRKRKGTVTLNLDDRRHLHQCDDYPQLEVIQYKSIGTNSDYRCCVNSTHDNINK